MPRDHFNPCQIGSTSIKFEMLPGFLQQDQMPVLLYQMPQGFHHLLQSPKIMTGYHMGKITFQIRSCRMFLILFLLQTFPDISNLCMTMLHQLI
jgi:hypothetical protein